MNNVDQMSKDERVGLYMQKNRWQLSIHSNEKQEILKWMREEARQKWLKQGDASQA